MRAQWVAVTVGAIGAVGLAAAGAWYFWRPAVPERTAAASAVQDSTGVATDSTKRLDTAGSVPSVDSVPARPVHPPALLGVWHHGDNRSKYGDSLTLVLEENGTATSAERRYTLDRTGWHVARVLREGSWAVRYRGSDRMDLCTSWTKPETVDVCERVTILPDTVEIDRPTMEFAGRHWRMARPIPAREASAAQGTKSGRSSHSD